MNEIPAWVWIGGGLVLLALFLHRSRAPVGDGTGQPIQPSYPGTGDKTKQQPKQVPPRG